MSQSEAGDQPVHQQSVGNVTVTGDENPVALVSATGNAAIDQSRHIIYNYYYYREETKSIPVAALADDLPCPYRGLFHFGPEDAEFFFGREVFASELMQAVQTRAFVPVLGASGSGKSSVVFAGLVPHLQRLGHWQFTHFRPGNDPFQALSLALVPLYVPKQDTTEQMRQARQLATYLRTGEVLLADVMLQIQRNYPQQRVLLIADQFEELYTLCTEEATRRGFLDCLLASLAAATKVSPLVLVATMRADFLGNALSYRPFADVLQAGDVKLGAMNREELCAVIEQPAAKLGVTFEAGLSKRILDAVINEPGNLPLLEFALTELWSRRNGRQLTHAAYEAIGEVEGALANYADQQYAKLTLTEQEQARWIFIQLVRLGEGTEDTRRLATKGELGEDRWALVTQLANSRLVVTSQDVVKQETVEVVHEALIRNWSELRRWLATDRTFIQQHRRIETAAKEWEEARGGLLQRKQLKDARAFQRDQAERFPLSAIATNFVWASQKQQANNLIRTISIAVILPIFVAIYFGFEYTRHSRTEKLTHTFHNSSKDEEKAQALQDLVKNGDSLSEYNLTNAKYLRAADLSNADFIGAKLDRAVLNGTRFYKANLQKANLRAANLSGAVLSGADLENANLSQAILNNTEFDYATLVNSKLIKVRLTVANLSNADLSNANLSNADLSNANLSNANLSNANLSNANLKGTILWKSNLIRANLSNNDGLPDAFLCETTMPNGEKNNRDCSSLGSRLFIGNKNKSGDLKTVEKTSELKINLTQALDLAQRNNPSKPDLAEKLRYEIIVAYYDLQQVDVLLQDAKRMARGTELTLRDNVALEGAGLGTRFDVLMSQVEYARAQLVPSKLSLQRRLFNNRLIID